MHVKMPCRGARSCGKSPILGHLKCISNKKISQKCFDIALRSAYIMPVLNDELRYSVAYWHILVHKTMCENASYNY